MKERITTALEQLGRELAAPFPSPSCIEKIAKTFGEEANLQAVFRMQAAYDSALRCRKLAEQAIASSSPAQLTSCAHELLKSGCQAYVITFNKHGTTKLPPDHMNLVNRSGLALVTTMELLKMWDEKNPSKNIYPEQFANQYGATILNGFPSSFAPSATQIQKKSPRPLTP